MRGVWDCRYSVLRRSTGAGTIFREKVSGARADRPQLAKLMAGLKAGDVVVVTKLDRLGRSLCRLSMCERVQEGEISISIKSAADNISSDK
jgi:DNA invertase Pin-like site-specific DNA recombinase